MSTFKAAIQICGLSQQEAADFLDVSFDTLKKWAQGKRNPPQGVWDMLSDLYERLEDAADGAAGQIEPAQMPPIAMNNIQVDEGADPLPGHGADAAGAMALLLAIRMDQDDQA